MTSWSEVWQQAASRWNAFGRRVARAAGWKVWNPGEYGEKWHSVYRRAYPLKDRPIMIFGLNPGPYGMAQTGIPFTDVKRLNSCLPVLAKQLGNGKELAVPGLAPRSLRPFLTRTFESSSVRVYRFLAEAFGAAETGVQHVVVANPCPLLFIDPKTGKNVTPADLTRATRAVGTHDAKALREEMDLLRKANCTDAVDCLKPAAVVLLGRNVQAALGGHLQSLGVRRIVDYEHPARAVPKEWSERLQQELRSLKILRTDRPESAGRATSVRRA